MAGIWGIVQAVLFVVSVAIQQVQARKARKAAKKAADNARGFQLVKDGEPSSVPVAYGRNLLGGIRVYHNTFNDYVFADVHATGVAFAAEYEVTKVLQPNERRAFAVHAQPNLQFDIAANPGRLVDGVLEGVVAGYSTTGMKTTGNTPGTTSVQWQVETGGQDSVTQIMTGTITWEEIAQNKAAHPGKYIYEILGVYQTSGPDVGKVIWGTPTPLKSFTPITDDPKTADLATWREDQVSESKTGGKYHEYLITQQVLCHGGIEAIYEAVVDDRRIGGEYFDPVSNEVLYPYDEEGMTPAIISSRLNAVPPTLAAAHPLRGSARIHAYKDGNVADPLAAANDDTRSSALFPGLAYATGAYKLNRENQQYSGVPTLQMFVEGMKVYDVTRSGSPGAYSYALSGSKTYSNNPARCLLDYLMSTKYGKGLTLDQIDLASFYNAIQICEKDVTSRIHPTQTEPSPLKMAGVFWRAKADKVGSGLVRTVKLYECNVTLDTSKPVRENIDILLDTMNDAMLIWSGGQYKLVVDYPEVWNTDYEHGGAPYAKDTIVQYTVESTAYTSLFRSKVDNNSALPHDGINVHANWEDIVTVSITDDNIVREGTVSIGWPDAQTRFNYATVRFLNESEDFKEDTVSWPPKSKGIANYWETVYKGQWQEQTYYSIGDRVTYGGSDYVCKKDTDVGTVSATVSPNVNPDNWMSYASFNGIHGLYLAEDSGLPLETDVFLEGVTTYYNAKAHAEALVRASRSQVTYTLPLDRTFFEVEPGDVLRLTSEVLNIPGDLVQVVSLNLDSSGVFNVTLRRYDARYYAWNVKDDEVVAKRKIFDNEVEGVTGLAFTTTGVTDAAGILSWEPSKEIRTDSYAIKYTGPGVPTTGTPWNDIKVVGKDVTSAVIPFNGFDDFNLTVVTQTPFGDTRKEKWPYLTVNAALKQVDGTTIVFTTENLNRLYTAGRLVWANPNDDRVTSYKFYTAPVEPITEDTVWTYQGMCPRADGVTTEIDVPHLMEQDYYAAVVSASGEKQAPRSGWPVITIGIVPKSLKQLELEASSSGVVFADDVTETPLYPDSVITITAKLTDIVGDPVFTATAYGAAAQELGSAVLPFVSGETNVRQLTPAQFATFPGTKYVTIYAELGGVSDALSIYRISNGNSVVFGLQNESVPVFANPNGVVASFDNVKTTCHVYQGTNEVTQDWTFSIVPNTCTATVNNVAGPVSNAPIVTVKINSMQDNNAFVDITASRTGYPTLTKRFSATKQIAGLMGVSIKAQYSVDGNTGWHTPFEPGDIFARYSEDNGDTWLDPVRIVGEKGDDGNYTSYVFKRSINNPAVPIGNNPSAQGWVDEPPAANGAPLWVSIGEFFNGVLQGTWSDPVQLEGAAGLTVTMTPDTRTLPCDSTGNNVNYDNSGFVLRVFEGDTELAYNPAWTNEVSSWKVVTPLSGSGISPSTSLTDSGAYLTVGNHSAMTADAATVTATIIGKRANGSAFSLTKAQSISKARTGRPLLVQYSVDGSTNWHSVFQANDIYSRYSEDNGTSWSIAVRIVGEKGNTGKYFSYIFKRAPTSSPPATPTGNDPTVGQGWYDAPPVQTLTGDVLWVSFAEFDGTTLQGTWSTPVQIEGYTARGVRASADARTFFLNSTGTTATPGTITLSRTLINVGGGTGAWSLQSGGFSGVTTGDATMTPFAASAMTTDAVTFRYTYTHTTGTYTDDIVITKTKSAIAGELSNDSVNLDASADGTVLDYAGAAGTFVLRNANGPIATSAIVFSIVGHSGFGTTYPTNTGISINSAGAYSVTSNILAATTTATVTFRAVYTDPSGGTVTVEKIFAIGKARAARSVVVSSDAKTFFVNASGTTSTPATITLSRTLYGLSGGSGSWSLQSGGFSGVTTGDATMTAFGPTSMTTDSVTFRYTYIMSGVTYSDDVVITKTRNSIVGELSNDSVTLESTNAGVIAAGDYATATGTFVLRTPAGVIDPSKITFTAHSNTGFTTPTIGTTAASNIYITAAGVYGVTGAIAAGTTTATVTFRAVYTDNVLGGGTVTIDKVFTIGKSRTGADAKYVEVTGTARTFFLDATGATLTPSTITLSRTLSPNLTGGSGAWSVVPGTGTFSGSLTGDATMAAFGPTSMTTDSVTFRYTYTAGSSTYTDDIIITKTRSPVFAELSNDSVNLDAANDGTVSVYTGASGVMSVKSPAGVIATSKLTFSVVGHSGFGTTYPTNTGISIDSSGNYSVTSNIPKETTVATVTFRAVYTDNVLGGATITMDKVFTIGKAKAGVDARYVVVSGSAKTFFLDATGATATPSTITLSRSLSPSLTGGSGAWSVVPGTGTFSGSLAGDATMTAFGPTSMTTDSVTFRYTYTLGANTYTDDIVIDKTRSNVVAELSNDSVNLDASNDGIISAYTGASGVMTVKSSTGTIATSKLTFSIVGHSGFGTTYPTNTGISIDASGNYSVTSNILAATAVATVTFRAVYTDNVLGGATITMDKIFTIGKAKAGVDARYVVVSGSAKTFFLDATGATATPSTITLSRSLSPSLTGGSGAWSVVPGTGTFSGSLTGDATMAAFGPTSMTTDSVTFRYTYTLGANTYTDDIVIDKTRSNVVAELSNDSVNLDANNAGAISSYSGASGVMTVKSATGTIATSKLTFSIAGHSGFGTTYPVNTGISIDASGNYSVTSNILAATAVATVTFRAVYTDNVLGGAAITMDKTFAIGKAKAGLSAKYVEVTGTAQTFFLDATGATATPSTITLSRTLRNLSGGSGAWSVVPGTGTFSGTLTGDETMTAFGPTSMTTDSVTFRYTYTENAIAYTDDIVVTKTRSTIVSELSNDSINLDASNDGVISAYTGASGVMTVKSSTGAIATSKIEFSVQSRTGFVASPTIGTTSASQIYIDSAGNYGVTGGILDATAVATVTFRAVYTDNVLGGATITMDKVFTIGKAKAGTPGLNGTAYWITTSAGAISRDITGAFNPTSVTVSASSQTGSSAVAAYPGWFKIDTSTDGAAFTNVYSSTPVGSGGTGPESSKAYTIAGATVKLWRFRLYKESGFTTLLDELVIPVIPEGFDGITILFPNNAHTLPSDALGNVTSYNGSGSTLRVLQGTTPLTRVGSITDASQYTIGTAVQNPLASVGTVGSWSGTTEATLTAHSGIVNTADVITLEWPLSIRTRDNLNTISAKIVQTLTKGKAGTNGTDGTPGLGGNSAKTLMLTSTGFAFVFADANATTSTSPTIVFDSLLQNTKGSPDYTLKAYNSGNTYLGDIVSYAKATRIFNFLSGALDGSLAFSRASVGTRFNSVGVIETISAGLPRFDHDPFTREPLGILIEESRTNILLNSATLATQSVSTSATAYTLSFYGAGQIVLSGTHSATVTGAGGFPNRRTYTFTPTAGTLTLTVTGSVTYAQLEAGAFETSYIPTTSGSVTRQADDCTCSSTAFSSWYSAISSEGTIYVAGRNPKSFTTDKFYVSVDASSIARMSLYSRTSGVATATFEVVNSTSQATINITGLTVSSDFHFAGAYKANDFGAAYGNTAGTPDTSGSVPSVSTLYVGRYTVGSYLNGHIACIAFYNTRRSAAELLKLSVGNNSMSFTPAQFVTYAGTRSVTVTSTLGTLSDTVTVYRGDGGSDALNARLTNESHTITESAAGVISYTGASGVMEVYKGLTLLSSGTTPSVTFDVYSNPSNLTGAGGGSVINSVTGAYSVANGMAGISLTTVTLRATLSTGQTLDKVFTIAKSKDGQPSTTPGPTGVRGSVSLYQVNASYTGSYGADNYKSAATAAILSATTASGGTPTTPIKGDTVTFGNGTNYATTYTNDGNYGTNGNNSWALPGNVIDGNMLITGTVTAGAIATNAVTADKILAGAITSGKIEATAIDGKTITGATIQTAVATNARIILTGSILKAENASGSSLIEFDQNGKAVFQGNASYIGNTSVAGSAALMASVGGATNTGTIAALGAVNQRTAGGQAAIIETASANTNGIALYALAGHSTSSAIYAVNGGVHSGAPGNRLAIHAVGAARFQLRDSYNSVQTELSIELAHSTKHIRMHPNFPGANDNYGVLLGTSTTEFYIGATALNSAFTGDASYKPLRIKLDTAELQAPYAPPSGGQLRLKTDTGASGIGVMLRHDGSSFYILRSNSAANQADGIWGQGRPFEINLGTTDSTSSYNWNGYVRIEKLRLGQMTTGTGDYAANNTAGGAALTGKPGSAASNNTWLTLNINGIDYYIPVWT